MFTLECARQRLLPGLDHNSLSDPLPELSLRGPELFTVAANDQRRFLSFLALLFLRSHQYSFNRSYEHTSSPACLVLIFAVIREIMLYPEGKPLKRGSVMFSTSVDDRGCPQVVRYSPSRLLMKRARSS